MYIFFTDTDLHTVYKVNVGFVIALIPHNEYLESESDSYHACL